MFGHFTRCLHPPSCILCAAAGVNGRDLCAGCAADLPLLGARCRQCAEPLAVAAEACGRCVQKPPAFVQTFALFHYAPPVDFLLQGLKFNRKLVHARVLSECMADWLPTQWQQPPECLIPVPLHATRLRERGYNQAVQLAKPLAKQLGLPLVYDAVKRQHATPPQAELKLASRGKNVRRAFVANPAFSAKHAAIVDDVMTTGSTVHAVATALKKVGVERVDVVVFARAGRLPVVNTL